jgi:ankyrin repeat protein
MIHGTPVASLRRLVSAIAAGDGEAASRLLEASPHLALESTTAGASRQSPAPHFLTEVQQYLYAGDTALHIAAAAYRADIAKELVSRGANVGARNRRGAEPLHYASVGIPGSKRWNPRAQAAIVEYLMRAGADANAADKSGVAPLHRAVRTRCAAAVRALLAHGADVRRKNRNGSTPLHLAVQNTGREGSGSPDAREQQAEIIRLLLQHGARPGDKDGHGKTVSEFVTAEWMREIVR